MVENAPTFAQIWQELRTYLDNRMVIAHNSFFDMGVLRSCIWQYHLPKPHFTTACTVQISRKVWPHLPNHKLNTLGEFFQIKFHHHDASDDAKVCAKNSAGSRQNGRRQQHGLNCLPKSVCRQKFLKPNVFKSY